MAAFLTVGDSLQLAAGIFKYGLENIGYVLEEMALSMSPSHHGLTGLLLACEALPPGRTTDLWSESFTTRFVARGTEQEGFDQTV